LFTRIAFDFHSAQALIVLALLGVGGRVPANAGPLNALG
jgi:hypothetical protein